MVLSQRAQGAIKDTIKITQIEPSLTGSLQTLTIPTFGSNEEGAYAFMNYMLSEQAQQIMVNDMAAIPLIDTSNIVIAAVLRGRPDLKPVLLKPRMNLDTRG